MSLKTTLIDAADLAALAPDDVLIVDCRFDLTDPEAGARAFEQGHVPGAVYAHLDQDLSGTGAPEAGRHPLPLPRALSATLSRWGWRAGMQVVSYDAAAGALAAARLWWLLRLAGVHDAAVLDGGYAAWTAAGHAVEAGPARPRGATEVDLRFDAEQTVDALGATAATRTGMLLDARAAPRYIGAEEPIDRVGGHVPGARNRPFNANLAEGGRFKSPDALRAEFLDLLGALPPHQVVHMCGSGVTACHNLLAMEHAGLHGSRLYPPSWSGWIGDRSRPVATGDAP